MNTHNNRHDDIRSMQFAAGGVVVLAMFIGAACWEVLRGYVLGAIS